VARSRPNSIKRTCVQVCFTYLFCNRVTLKNIGHSSVVCYMASYIALVMTSKFLMNTFSVRKIRQKLQYAAYVDKGQCVVEMYCEHCTTNVYHDCELYKYKV